MSKLIGRIAGFSLVVAIFLSTFVAWVQHFITTVSQEMWVLLVVGAIIPPIGVLHGWLIWLGAL